MLGEQTRTGPAHRATGLQELGYRRQLDDLPDEELFSRYEALRQQQARQQEAARQRKLASLLHNLDASRADHGYWCKMATWTVDEATALSLDRDPRWVQTKQVAQYLTVDPFARAYVDRLELIRRASDAGQLPAAITATVFVSWAEGLGVQIPDPMKDGARRYGGMAERQQVGRQTATADHEELPDAAKAETQPLREELTSPASASAAAPAISAPTQSDEIEKPLSPRVHNSLLKMVIGMAMGRYKHDPASPRSDAISAITRDIEKLGLSLDPDTVRHHVKEASKLVSHGRKIP